MATCTIFEEDEVYVCDDKGFKSGLVLECAEFLSSDEEDESNEDNRVTKGTVRVAWHPLGEETVVEETNLKLADRSLMPGDVIRRLSDGKDSQKGYVRNTNVSCHVQLLGKKDIIFNVDSCSLRTLTQWDPEPGDVTLDCWVGKIENINEEVTLEFSDGASCKISDDEFINELFRFEDVRELRCRNSEFCNNCYYVGQQFKGSIGDLESAEWIQSTAKYSNKIAKKYPNKSILGTVSKIETKSIDIHWLCRGYANVENSSNKMEPPPRHLDKKQIKNLRRLDCFEPCSLQIGDKAYCKLKEGDIIHTISCQKDSLLNSLIDSDGSVCNSNRDVIKKSKMICSSSIENIQKSENASMNCHTQINGFASNEAEEIYSDDYVDVDEEFEHGNSSSSESESTVSNNSNISNKPSKKKKGRSVKGPIWRTRMQKHKRMKLMVKKKLNPLFKDMKPGKEIPVEVLYTSSLIEVMWQDGTIERNIPSADLFPIHHLDEFEFFPGDFIIKCSESTSEKMADDIYGVIEKVNHLDRICKVKWLKPYEVGKYTAPDSVNESEDVSVYDIKDHPDYKFRPGHVVVRVGGYDCCHHEAAGQVYELKTDGSIVVQWANKDKTVCYPQELYLFGDELSELGSDLDSSSDESEDEDETSSEASWETETEEEIKESTKGDSKYDQIQSLDSNFSLESDLQVQPEKKVKLDVLLDTARASLQVLEETFSNKNEACPNVVSCFRQISNLHKICRELNKLVGADYFRDPQLVACIQRVRKEMKNEKAAGIARQVLELYESNLRQHGACEESLEKKTETCIEKNPTEDATVNSQLNLFDAYSSSYLSSSYLLCQTACSLLKDLIMKVHDDLNKKWDELKAAGRLKLFGEDEDEEDDATLPPELAAAVAAAEAGENKKKCSTSEMTCDESVGTNISTPSRQLCLEINSSYDCNNDPKQLYCEPSTPQTPAEIRAKLNFNFDGFNLDESACTSHRFYGAEHKPTDPKSFFSAIKKELRLLRSSLPHGIYVKGYEDRMDLYSVMIIGPEGTPYEDGLFFFDVQLPSDYPSSPPSVHYISFCSDRLNPNLYEDGKVCVSLLGTWQGKGTEIWHNKSSLLQVLVSIQGLILVDEPYFNEAGYEKQKITPEGQENSRMYNEMSICKLVQSMTKIAKYPPESFKSETVIHLKEYSNKFINRLEGWLNISEKNKNGDNSSRLLQMNGFAEHDIPKFSLFPASKGFCITLRKNVINFKTTLVEWGITAS